MHNTSHIPQALPTPVTFMQVAAEPTTARIVPQEMRYLRAEVEASKEVGVSIDITINTVVVVARNMFGWCLKDEAVAYRNELAMRQANTLQVVR